MARERLQGEATNNQVVDQRCGFYADKLCYKLTKLPDGVLVRRWRGNVILQQVMSAVRSRRARAAELLDPQASPAARYSWLPCGS
jgi:hypothetical protein